jgi:hypothetical protein
MPDDAPRTLTAYTFGHDAGWAIEPSAPTRGWMDRTPQKFAYRCLPLIIANQAGWVVRLPGGVRATWNGKPEPAGVTLAFSDAPDHFRAQVGTNFGCGIVSFAFPWVFRTPPGVGLLVRGVPNHDVPNAVPCEGVVETDWATQAFTMNYRISARNRPVYFKPGDPVCALTPIALDLLEDLEPRRVPIAEDPEMVREMEAFQRRKRESAAGFDARKAAGEDYKPTDWKLDYMRGRTSTGAEADRHRTNLKLRPFVEPSEGSTAP